MTANQLLASLLVVFLASAASAVLVLGRPGGKARKSLRAWLASGLGGCAIIAMAVWLNFGDMHSIFVEGPGHHARVERHVPFHFHEFFHYYLGSKYFRELGYGGLYDCTALGDAEAAKEDGVPPRVGAWVRDLDDVLTDKTYEAALDHCRTEVRPHFSDARWAQFENDLRELRRLVPDGWWNDATFDAGFNPPPSWCMVGGAIANVIPIRLAGMPTYLVATTLDMVLIVACFFALRRSFGGAAAATAAIYFGASFIAGYGWNGGAYLRYTWVVSLALGLAASRRGKWVLAGALLGAAACDRVFPAAFAVGVALPLALRARESLDDRRRLTQLGMGFAGAMVVLVVLSAAFFGVGAWQSFFARILKHGDIYYVMHIGLKKVLTWRPWVAHQDFHGHIGLRAFRDWNIHLRETWASTRLANVALQLSGVALAGWAGARRKPYESGLLFGICAMFLFQIPANYYYVVLVLVPALLLRAGITAPTFAQRLRELAALTAFTAFWLVTLIASRVTEDPILCNHLICVALGLFLVVWLGAWLEPRRALRPAVVAAPVAPEAT